MQPARNPDITPEEDQVKEEIEEDDDYKDDDFESDSNEANKSINKPTLEISRSASGMPPIHPAGKKQFDPEESSVSKSGAVKK